MASLKLFDIDIHNLSLKEYDYQFDIDNSFFALFEDSIVEKGSLTAKVNMSLHPGVIEMDFAIQGSVVIICDRSLEEYDQEINTNDRLLFKFGDENTEISEEIISITRDTHRINVAQYIYEFITIAIPFVKRHPRFQQEEDNDDEVKLIYQSSTAPAEDEEDKDSEDPRWALLKNLKNNLN
ncbi:MAG: hypothetical protein K0R51_1867 [Cytophagaceae bacterium]|jgi:uncharacterized metal-binding protein YceD (DUF177 family)|nr:hypothetical protein [Cytophagaceae bacterium]